MQHMSGACSTFYFASIAVISRGTYKPASEAAELAMTVTYCQPDQVMIKLVLFIVAELEGSLLIQLNGETYPSDSTIPITDVGAFDPSTGHLSPDSSLVCVTSELNTQCCRTRDGGNVGEWLFPNGTMVPRNKNSPDGDFTRSGYRHQVRLSRKNNAISPSGTFTCLVPREDGCGGYFHAASITLSK